MSGVTGTMTIRRVRVDSSADGEPCFAWQVLEADGDILVSGELIEQLKQGPVEVARLDDDLMTVTAANGVWRYRLGERDEHGNHHASMVEGSVMRPS